MFELPEAKRVRRSELHSTSSSRADSPVSEDEATATAARAALASYFSSQFEEAPEPESSYQADSRTVSKPSKTKDKLKKTRRNEKDASDSVSKEKNKKKKKKKHKKPKPKEQDSDGNSVSDSDAEPSSAQAILNREESAPAPTYSFRLFSAAPGQASTPGANPAPEVAQIVLEAGPADGEAASGSGGGFVAPRPRSFYVAAPWSAAQRAECAAIACSPAGLAAEAARHWPGCAVPWRVSTVRIGRGAAARLEAWSSGGNESKGLEERPIEGRLVGPDGNELSLKDEYRRRRPGKKRRLIMRNRARAKVEAEEERAREKTKKNREKKVRRKLKSKEKEASGADNCGNAMNNKAEEEGNVKKAEC